MSRNPVPWTLAAVAALACGDGAATGPDVVLCDVRHEVEVCADRAEYERTDPVTITVRNLSSSPILKDGCGIKLVGVTNLTHPFEEEYLPTLRCGRGVTLAEVRANMVRIEPGGSYTEELSFHFFAFQGYYRANVWLLDEEGNLAVDTPATSGIFRMFPAATE